LATVTVYSANQGTARLIEAREGQTILDVLREQQFACVAPCGGKGTCHKCAILVVDRDEPRQVLACQAEVTEGMRVFLSRPAVMDAQDFGHAATSVVTDGHSGLGIAVDVGTTTLVSRLYDLATGALLGTVSQTNPQVIYGSDVVSRIEASMDGALDALHGLLIEALREQSALLCAQAHVSSSRVTLLALVGNTVMEHIAAGLAPDSIGFAPFKPLTLFGETREVAGLPAPAFFGPAVAGYVGSDVTAGLYALGVQTTGGPELFIDLGTNGELALTDSTGIHCSATAAGPVFEGAGIHFGMPALPGAIAHVSGAPGALKLGIIGDAAVGSPHSDPFSIMLLQPAAAFQPAAASEPAAFQLADAAPEPATSSDPVDTSKPSDASEPANDDSSELPNSSKPADALKPADDDALKPADAFLHRTPTGICGTGLIDAVALMLRYGIIDASGYMLSPEDIAFDYAHCVGREAGQKVFYLTQDRSLYITQADVRNLQLAKGAVRAGIETLLAHYRHDLASIKRLSVAGGFGYRLNLMNAARLGLFPRALLAVATSVGNTAIEGASAALLSAQARQAMIDLAKRCDYIELATSQGFTDHLMDALAFDGA
jgi:uncharacterized 2Fe-2S/4Fe-4S cluster protein (DUF4445 family)